MGLINWSGGFSSLGEGVAKLGGAMALQQQQSMLNQDAMKLADELATVRERTGREHTAEIAKEAQGRQFGHEETMQTGRLSHESGMQGERLKHETTQQDTRLKHDVEQQGRQIQAQKDITQMQIEKLPDEVRNAEWFAKATLPQKRAYVQAIMAKAGLPTWAIEESTGGLNEPAAPATPPKPGEEPKPSEELKPPQQEGSPKPEIEGLPTKTAKYNEDALKGKPQQVADMVRAMVEGRMKPPSDFSASKPYWASIIGLANQYDPSFDQTVWTARVKTRASFSAGKDKDNLNAINTAIGHAGDLAFSFDKLNNTSLPSVNAALNWAQQQLGDPRQSVTKQGVDALASEARKVFAGSGGGNLTELQEWQSNFPLNGSPEQQRGALKMFTHLLKSRIDAMAETYNRAMGLKEDSMSFMTPKARETFEALEAGKLPPEPGKEAAAKLPQAPPDPTERAPGTEYMLPNGKKGTWNGEGWINVK